MALYQDQLQSAAGEPQVAISQPLPAGTNLVGKATISQGGNDALVDGTGALKVNATVVMGTATTGTLSQVARSNASAVMLAANSSRKGFSVFNNSAAIAYIAFAATASAAAFTARVQGNSLFEDDRAVPYTGVISIIWASNGSGDAQVTELS